MRSTRQYRFRLIPICMRVALFALVAGVVAFHPSPPAAHAGTTNVGGNPIHIVFSAPTLGPQPTDPPTDPSSWPQLDLAKSVNLICAAVPSDLCSQLKTIANSSLLTQPLVNRFNDIWNTNKGQNGETMLQSSCDQAKQQIMSNINSSTGQNAYNISCNFATTGTVNASIGTTEDTSNCPPGSLPSTCGQNVPDLVLSYYLSNNQVNFTTTKPNLCTQNAGTVIGNILTGGAGCIADTLSDPTFNVTFDAEVDLFIELPTEPCTMTPNGGEVLIHNASINGTNAFGDLAQFASSVEGAINPNQNAFPAAEQTLDDTIQPINISIGSDFSSMQAGCGAAVYQGFTQFNVIPDPNNGLTFKITHPLDQTTVTGTTAPSTPPPSNQPSLIHPSITATPTQVPVKNKVTVAGSYFPGSNATEIQIGWADPGDEQLALADSDVQWGEPGHLTTVHIARTHDDDNDQFTANNLKPDTKYEFLARDCDQITCSLWSTPLDITTASTTANQVTIYLDKVASANSIGTADPDPNGNFTQAVTIPASTSAGKHSLIAVGGGNQQAGPIDITVLGANETANPEVDVIDSTNARVTSAVQTYSYTAQGSYFTDGGKVSLYFDNATGTALATATVASDGTFQAKFTVPFSVASGNHKLLAVETVNGQTLQATDDLFIQSLPQ